ncbi:MAG: YdeI/OmpD-associated family protein [Pseudonocardia sp.]|nr:YdeI/OmpD-associated family protein [Pseudonocardia sp.]
MDVDREVLDFADPAGWETWLERNRDRSAAWLRIARRRSGLATITISDALDGALCFGWIDGQRRSLDDVSFLQRYSRRRPRSSWSRVNVAKVEALTAAGRMRPGGLAEVDAAKADGRWAAAYEPQRTAEVPADLAAALAADPAAGAAFEGLGRSERYAVILPLLKARTESARATVLARATARLAGSQVTPRRPGGARG